MSSRKQNPRYKLRCQECGNICPTRHLDFDVICWSCDGYAKRANQKVIAKTEIYRNKEREVFIVV